MSDTVMERPTCFQLKTSFLPCTTLQLQSYDPEQLAAQLDKQVQRAPTFFVGSPLVLDIDNVKQVADIDFALLKQIMVNNNMVPVGVRGGTEDQRFKAAKAGLPTLNLSRNSQPNTGSQASESETPEPQPEPAKLATKPQAANLQNAKIITTPIRSGMQIYAKDCDLIVLSSVSVGAELLADGNIHVYGTLRGRALAGVQGNTEARIFCKNLEAELIAIAGYYLVKDDLHHDLLPTSMVQIYLEDEQVKIQAL